MPRSFTVLVIVSMLFLGASLIALLTLMGARAGANGTPDQPPEGPAAVSLPRTVTAFDPRSPLTPSPLLDGAGLVVPAFRLVDQDNRPVDESVFDGRVTVMAFVFTHCELACPIVTGRMYGVYQDAQGLDVNYLSFSVDPIRDTPDVLKAYAANFGIDHDRWSFLTGDYETVERVATEGMRFAIEEDPSDDNVITLADGSTMRNIQHPTKLILVGPDRGVIGIYDPYLQTDLDLLGARLRAFGRASQPR